MSGPGKRRYNVADCTGANCKPSGMRTRKSGIVIHSRKDRHTPPPKGHIDPPPPIKEDETTNLEVVKHGEGYSQKLYSGTNTPEAVKKYGVKGTDIPTSKKKTVDVEETEDTAPKSYSAKKITKADAVISAKKKLVR